MKRVIDVGAECRRTVVWRQRVRRYCQAERSKTHEFLIDHFVSCRRAARGNLNATSAANEGAFSRDVVPHT